MSSAISLQTAITQRDAWLAASIKVAGGEEYRMNGRFLKMSDLEQIRKTLEYWENKVKTLEGSAGNKIQIRKAKFN